MINHQKMLSNRKWIVLHKYGLTNSYIEKSKPLVINGSCKGYIWQCPNFY